MNARELEFRIRVLHTTKDDPTVRFVAMVDVLAETETEAHLVAAQMVSATRHDLHGTVIGTTTEGVVA